MPSTAPIRNQYPHLNARARGWLRHLHHKAHTADDWSEDGQPHEWWDRYSSDPMLSFPRFDLSESSYALGIMADQTPAWREVYAGILEQLAERHLSFWAAVDWLTQIGPDPRRNNYPPEWIGTLIPEHLVGQYDTPGWVANGIEPWGLQSDPIGADGNLFFKGWLNLTQSLHAYVTGEDRWGSPFEVAGVERTRFEWTQHRLVQHLSQQWTDNPLGPHCENTKVWPFCLTAAGLGLQLYDAIFSEQSHQVYDSWLEHTKPKYYGIDKQGALEWVAMYYDPLAEHLHATGPNMGLAIAFYAAPQNPDFAEYLYRSAVRFLQWDNPASPVLELPEPRLAALGLAVAREFGDYATEARLRDYAESHFEPRYFGESDDEFGFWFGLGENWPRGQLSSLAMVAEVGQQGSWRKLFQQPDLAKFYAPTVEGVDYPTLGIAQAYNDLEAGMLQLHTFAGDTSKRGQATSFCITQLPDTEAVKVICDGAEYPSWRVTGDDRIEINTTVDTCSLQVYTGYRDAPDSKSRSGIARASGHTQSSSNAPSPSSASSNTRASRSRILTAPSVLCGCCI